MKNISYEETVFEGILKNLRQYVKDTIFSIEMVDKETLSFVLQLDEERTDPLIIQLIKSPENILVLFIIKYVEEIVNETDELLVDKLFENEEFTEYLEERHFFLNKNEEGLFLEKLIILGNEPKRAILEGFWEIAEYYGQLPYILEAIAIELEDIESQLFN